EGGFGFRGFAQMGCSCAQNGAFISNVMAAIGLRYYSAAVGALALRAAFPAVFGAALGFDAFFGFASAAAGGAARLSDLASAFALALPPVLRPAARRPFGELPSAAARASSSTMASSSVTVSGVLSDGSVALTP